MTSLKTREKIPFTDIPEVYCNDEAMKEWKREHSCKWCYDYDYEKYIDCGSKYVIGPGLGIQ